jgi:hypothetical protein
MLERTKTTALAACLLLLVGGAASAQSDSGGEAGSNKQNDPTASSAGDPHGAIRAMSKASEPDGKPDHAKTTIPDSVIPGSGAAK